MPKDTRLYIIKNFPAISKHSSLAVMIIGLPIETPMEESTDLRFSTEQPK